MAGSYLTFGLDELRQKYAQAESPYNEFLRRRGMSVGLYVLPVGVEDKQTPHMADEVYVVLQGRGRLRVVDEEVAVEPGQGHLGRPRRGSPVLRRHGGPAHARGLRAAGPARRGVALAARCPFAGARSVQRWGTPAWWYTRSDSSAWASWADRWRRTWCRPDSTSSATTALAARSTAWSRPGDAARRARRRPRATVTSSSRCCPTRPTWRSSPSVTAARSRSPGRDRSTST